MTQGKRVHEYPNGPRTSIANTVHSPIIQPFHRNASLCLSVRWDLSRPRRFPRSFFPFPQLGGYSKLTTTNYNFRKCIKFRKISVGWCLSQFYGNHLSKVMGSMPFVVNTLGAQHANLLGDLELTQLLWFFSDTNRGECKPDEGHNSSSKTCKVWSDKKQIRVCTIVCKIYIYNTVYIVYINCKM